MSTWQQLLAEKAQRWLVTGAAGFIGSHLVESLLKQGQTVVGLDNFSTGYRKNVDAVRSAVGVAAAARFTFIEADITDPVACAKACQGVQRVLHQAALGSVPRSMENPRLTHVNNVDGFFNMLVAARDAKVERFVYASSSSVYGSNRELPKQEDKTGQCLSPYAASKAVNETYALAFEQAYGLRTAGLRYFNVFGPRQDPNGAYAAVIPRWTSRLVRGEACEVYGDGETSRDFCYVDNVVQANVLAALREGADVSGTVYNVAVGTKTSLNQLYRGIRALVPGASAQEAKYLPERKGDIRDSLADISRVQARLGYSPTHTLQQGLEVTVPSFLSQEPLG
ncbi:MAG: SDR family oxidoreductase [Myxococcaceae bacterium]|nr:SDR family oxidoreductase [Myxococcaceae bacterium]